MKKKNKKIRISDGKAPFEIGKCYCVEKYSDDNEDKEKCWYCGGILKE